MNILGISAGFHDAAACVIDPQGEILFAAHSERYSGTKNDAHLHARLMDQCLRYPIDQVALYERPWMHNLQYLRSGQRPLGPWTTRESLRRLLGQDFNPNWRCKSWSHHLSHAAAGFQTSGFDSAAVVVIDAIGELDTITIYKADWYQGRARYCRLWSRGYPHSIGLMYTAVTDYLGLRPMEDEYITMGMAAYGSDSLAPALQHAWVKDIDAIKFRHNLHQGIPHEQAQRIQCSAETMAASVQTLTETMIMNVMRRAKWLTGESNLVYMGGVALNCVANSRLGSIFDRIWIMPNPGDAGSCLGAAALSLGRPLQWRTAFLGHNIAGAYPVKACLDVLLRDKIVGVASGRAEFGPRALGNRSLLADPRGSEIKDKVNEIKRRQKFRPFAPVILEEHVDDYFDMPRGWRDSRYMQIVAACRRPDLYPAVVHADGTSRVQTVTKDGSGIRQLLETWYVLTGCPMLLNTSLNIRGEPMVNDRQDADRFTLAYGVKVCS
jgi:carbamoyltransferase